MLRCASERVWFSSAAKRRECSAKSGSGKKASSSRSIIPRWRVSHGLPDEYVPHILSFAPLRAPGVKPGQRTTILPFMASRYFALLAGAAASLSSTAYGKPSCTSVVRRRQVYSVRSKVRLPYRGVDGGRRGTNHKSTLAV